MSWGCRVEYINELARGAEGVAAGDIGSEGWPLNWADPNWAEPNWADLPNLGRPKLGRPGPFGANR